MTFAQSAVKSPSSIGTMVIILKDWPADSEMIAGRSAAFQIEVKYSDGSREIKRGNLAPHLTPTQQTNLQNFLIAIRQQAQAEILP